MKKVTKTHPAQILPAKIRLLCSGILLLSLLVGCSKESSTEELLGNWTRRPEFEGVGRTEAVLFSIANKVYLGGGYDGKDRLNDFWSFDQTTGNWLRIASFPGVARTSAIAFELNGKGYVGTGYDDEDNRLQDFWEYDPTTDTWTRKADFAGTPRYGAVAFVVSGKGYVATGYDGNYLKDMFAYDPLKDEWAQVASFGGSKRTDAVAFVHDNKAYLLSGFNNGSYLNDFWVYNPETNQWTEKRKISSVSDDSYDDDYGDNIRRSNATILVSNDKAYLTNGTRGAVIPSTWEYNITNDTWIEKTAFEGSAREGSLGFTLNNRLYIVTGNNSSYRFDDLWEFSPNAEQDDNDN